MCGRSGFFIQRILVVLFRFFSGLARVRFPAFVDSMPATCGWFSFAAKCFWVNAFDLRYVNPISSKLWTWGGGSKLKVDAICDNHVLQNYMCSCCCPLSFVLFFFLFSELTCLIYLVLLWVTVRKPIMTTQFRMQPFGCGHKPLHQVMADHRDSPPSFPP